LSAEIKEKMMALTIVDRFHPKRRLVWQAAADEGRLRLVDEAKILEPEQLLPLARLSLQLLVVSGIFFIVLNLFAYIWRTGQHNAGLTFGEVLLWLLVNIVSYVLILPLHELLHGAAFAFWGGTPYYKAQLPIALACGAKDQVFPRNYYLVVGLTPFVVITMAGIVFTLLAPALSPYVLLATVGNVSGAASDLQIASRLRALPPSVFVEDMATGYRVWEVTDSVGNATIASDRQQDQEV
jgi:hypothetical protein